LADSRRSAAAENHPTKYVFSKYFGPHRQIKEREIVEVVAAADSSVVQQIEDGGIGSLRGELPRRSVCAETEKFDSEKSSRPSK